MKINENSIYVLDFETGGLKAWVNGVCSCTIKKLNDKEIKNFFFKPTKTIYEVGAFKVNNINIDDLFEKGINSKRLIEYIDNIYNKIVEEKKQYPYITFCGWNVGFDLDFLTQIYRENKVKFPCPIISYDLLEIAKKNIKKKDLRKKEDEGVDNYKLTTIYQFYFDDFVEEKSHTAEYDVLMTEKIYNKFKELKYI